MMFDMSFVVLPALPHLKNDQPIWKKLIGRFFPIVLHPQLVKSVKERQKFEVLKSRKATISADVHRSVISVYRLLTKTVLVEARRISPEKGYKISYQRAGKRVSITELMSHDKETYKNVHRFPLINDDRLFCLSCRHIDPLRWNDGREVHVIVRENNVLWMAKVSPEIQDLFKQHLQYAPKLLEHIRMIEGTLQQYSFK